ncbi:MAG TPA: response regulator [Methylomirabilota bacterium]|nr:response regulator [Methylomirabilota bacterium]
MVTPGTTSPVRILHLEDDPIDTDLIQATLGAHGVTARIQRVDTGADFKAALARRDFDLILADYNVPSFNGLAALDLARKECPEIPFLFVSGLIGEERALDSLKTGATDYVFKHNLARLGPAVRRALDEAAERSERRRAEAALRDSEATLRSFFDTAPFLMGVVEWQDDTIRFLSANLATARWLGTTPEALRGCSAADCRCSPQLIESWLRALREARKTSAPAQFEAGPDQTGQDVFFAFTVSSLATPAGAAPRFCYVAENITEKRRLEQQFLRAQRMESIGTLASGIAHDLNNVLAPIIMSLKLFRAKLPDADDQHLLDNLESSARRGADIVKQVLHFVRGAEGVRDTLPLPKLIHDLEHICRDTFPRSIHIETRVAHDLWPVTGDATQVYQVLMNLSVNARDAMPEGGRLTISVDNALIRQPQPHHFGELKPGSYVTLTVSDTGTGIAPAILDRIFEPFFTTKEVGQGTGLGLSTVLSIVKGHNGFLSVASQLNRGTTFKIYLPADHQGATAAAEPAAPSATAGTGELVLVVDDEPTIRLVTRRTLEENGYAVLVAADGAEALALFARQRRHIRLVITDMMMPSMDGAAFVRSLRRFAPDVPIIGVSGLMDERKAMHAAGLEGVAFLRKPFSADQLLQTVRDTLHTGARVASAKA